MVNAKSLLMRSTSAVSIVALTAAVLLPVAFSGMVSAAIPSSRSITLETSAAGNVDTIYSVSFNTDPTGGSYNLAGLVVEFCSESPIVGDSACTTPTGFDLDETNIVVASQVGVTDWVVDGASDTNTLILTSATGPNLAQNTTVSFDLGNGGANGVTNPTTANQTFYARIVTYTTSAAAQGYTSAAPGTYQDGGGIAMSTAAEILVTAKVAERLTFCVYTNANCGLGGTDVTLGDANGILDPTGPFVDKSTKFDISTNASGNAVVVLKGDTLDSGGPTISAIGGTAATSSAGTEQFGFCLYESAGSGLTIAAPYDNSGTPANCNSQTSQTAGTAATGGAGTAEFAFDTTATTSASGDLIATKPAGDASTAIMPMIGNIAFATEAGIYTATLTYVATGTY